MLSMEMISSLDQILLVAPRQQHRGDPGARRCHHLGLDPTDREDLPAQRDLTGHRSRSPGPAVREDGDDCGHQRDTRRGAVLGDGSGGHVEMDLARFQNG